MLRLCGLGGLDCVRVYCHASEEAADLFAVAHPSALSSDEKTNGSWPPAVVLYLYAYDTHIFNFFLWQFIDRPRNALFGVMMHEVAHAMTAIWNLVNVEDERVQTFVNERIIMPILNSMTYDPLNKVMIGRRMTDEHGHVIDNPLILPRGDN